MIGNSYIDLGRPVSNHELNRGLVSWWLALNQGPYFGGARFLDLMNRNHGTLSNGPTWGGPLSRQGGFGSLKFNGSNSYIAIPAVAAFQPQTLTAMSWVKFNTLASNQMVFGHHVSSTGGWAIWGRFGTQSALIGQIGDGTADYFFGLQIPVASFVINTWYHLALTFDGFVGRLYKDGIEADSHTKTTTITYDGVAEPRIGERDVFGDPLDGSADDVRMFNRALSASEVQSLYYDSLRGYPLTLNRLRRTTVFDVGAAAANTKRRDWLFMGMGV